MGLTRNELAVVSKMESLGEQAEEGSAAAGVELERYANQHMLVTMVFDAVEKVGGPGGRVARGG